MYWLEVDSLVCEFFCRIIQNEVWLHNEKDVSVIYLMPNLFFNLELNDLFLILFESFNLFNVYTFILS